MIHYKRRIKKYDPEVAEVKEILEGLNIRYCISWTEKRMWYSGVFKNGKIYVYVRWFSDVVDTPEGYSRYVTRRCTVQEFLSTVFHEVGHFIQDRDGKFKTYVKGFDPKSSYSMLRKWAKEALAAERDADATAARLMHRYFPEVPFKGSYGGLQGERWIQGAVESIRQSYFPNRKPLTATGKKGKVKR